MKHVKIEASNQTSPTYNSEIVRELTRFSNLESEWNQLFRCIRCNNPFLTFDWIQTWWFHFDKRRQLFIVTVRDSEARLIALAPFSCERQLNKLQPRCIRFLGDRYVASDHLSILAEPKHDQLAAEEIARQLLRNRDEWDYIRLSNCVSNSRTMTHFINTLTASGMIQKQMSKSVCPLINLPASFETYLASLSKNMRANFRRSYRLLGRTELNFVCAKENDEIQNAFHQLIRLHRLRFKYLRKKSSFVQQNVLAFHHDVIEKLSAHGRVRIYTLYTGQKAVASLYGFVAGNKFMYFQSGIDPILFRFSVGSALIGLTIRDVIENTDCDEFDFLRGAEAYKLRWASDFKTDVTIFLFDRRLLSQLALQLVKVDALIRRIKVWIKVITGIDPHKSHQ